jgi:hypothetical protein
LLELAGNGTAIVRTTNTNPGIGENALIGGYEFYKADASGSGAGVVGAVRMRSADSVGSSAYMTFSTALGGTANDVERVRITGVGRVGIGITNPSEHLHVAGDMRVGTGIGSGNTIHFSRSGQTDAARIACDANSNLAFHTNAGERARIDSSGRLLVGTSSASQVSTLLLQGRGSATGAAIARLCTTNAAPADGDALGIVAFSDSGHTTAAQISVVRDGGTWTSGTSQPTRLEFSTTADGASSPTERMRIQANGILNVPAVYTNTSASAANVFVDSGGKFFRSTSSIKYKTNVETLENIYADALLSCRPVWYRSTCEGDNPSHGWWGFIAEEVAEIDPRLVHWKTTEISHDENGSVVETPCDPEPEGVAYDRFVPHLLNLIKRQGEAIADLQAEVAALKAQ